MLAGVWRCALRASSPLTWSSSQTIPQIQRLAFSFGVRLWSSESEAKREKVAVALREDDLDESFVKGWGKGGQKINKVRNCVLLKHLPTGLHVRCQETRSLDGNRRIARRLLLQKLDDQVNGALSKRNLKIEKLRKKKSSRRNKSKQKYAKSGSDDDEDDADDEDDDEEEEENEEDEMEDEDEDIDENILHDDGDVEIVDFDVEEHKFQSTKKNKNKK